MTAISVKGQVHLLNIVIIVALNSSHNIHNKIYVFGGYTLLGCKTQGTCFGFYPMHSQTVRKLADMPTPRSGMCSLFAVVCGPHIAPFIQGHGVFAIENEITVIAGTFGDWIDSSACFRTDTEIWQSEGTVPFTK